MTTSETSGIRFAVTPALATVLGMAILIGLGVWQVQRLHWKEGLLARIAALQSAPPEPLEVVLRRAADGLDIDYVRVRQACPDIETAPYLRLYSVKDGYAGYRIIAACRLAGGAYAASLKGRGDQSAPRASRISRGDCSRHRRDRAARRSPGALGQGARSM